MSGTITSVNLSGVTGNVYALAGATTQYSNVAQNNAINFLIPLNASVQITNPNYTSDPVTGFHVLETLQVQGSSGSFSAWSSYGHVMLTNNASGQSIEFQLTVPTGAGGGNNSGVNVQFTDGSIAFTSNVSSSGVWTVWMTQGGAGAAGTTGWGNGSQTIPWTAATAINLSSVGYLFAPSVNSSGVTSWSLPNPTPTLWSASSGHGEISVLNALDLAMGKMFADVAAPIAPIPGSISGVGAVQFQDAWAAGYTGKGVVIAEIDSGIDLNNSALTHNLSPYNWNFVSNTANVQDDNNHGSFVASELVAAAGSSNNGVVGGAYDAQLMVLKVLDASGSYADSNTIATAITYAVDHGANVINMSLGGTSPYPPLQTALQYAASHGVVIAIGAGNSSGSSPIYPAYYAQTVSTSLAVGAIQQSGSAWTLANFSNQAGGAVAYNFVDAPGVYLQGYNAHGQVVTMSGTSMATPLVAAEAAILEQAIKTAHPDYSATQLAAQVVSDITQSATALSLVGVNSLPEPIFGMIS